jgi:hypothetical protein
MAHRSFHFICGKRDMCEPATLTAIGAGIASAASSAGAAVATAASGITLAGAATAATAVSGAVGAYGAIAQGKAQKSQARYQSAVERNNATIAGWQATDAQQRGQIEEQRQRLATARLRGAQRAGMAANGIEIDSGSPLDVLMDTAQLGELDALTIRSNAEREAYGFRSQSGNLMAQAGLTQMAGRSAQTAGYIGAGSTLLSTAATAGDRAATYKKYGI